MQINASAIEDSGRIRRMFYEFIAVVFSRFNDIYRYWRPLIIKIETCLTTAD